MTITQSDCSVLYFPSHGWIVRYSDHYGSDFCTSKHIQLEFGRQTTFSVLLCRTLLYIVRAWVNRLVTTQHVSMTLRLEFSTKSTQSTIHTVSLVNTVSLIYVLKACVDFTSDALRQVRSGRNSKYRIILLIKCYNFISLFYALVFYCVKIYGDWLILRFHQGWLITAA